MINTQAKLQIKLIRTEQDFHRIEPCVATMGNFDALHRGHQALLVQVQLKAQMLNLVPTVITFEPLPQAYLQPHKPLFRLLDLRQKVQYLDRLGFKQIVCLRFNRRLAQSSPEEFFCSYLIEKLKVKCLLVGENFRFGHQQAGNVQTLKTLGQAYSCEIISVPLETTENMQISSTQIRQALQGGDLPQVKNLLGRHYSLSGRIAKGLQRGRQLGFPTANLPLKNPPLVKGVFIVEVVFAATAKTYYGLLNIGTRPTVDGKNYLAEVHILDFNETIYGQRLEIKLLHKLREERRFANLEQLRQQITQDLEQARVWLEYHQINVNLLEKL